MGALYTLLPFLFFIYSCQASYYFDLMETFQLTIDPKITGTTIIGGPKNNQKAIEFGDTVPIEQLYQTGLSFAYLMNSIMNSNDFTFHTYLKFSTKFTGEKRWPLFVLQNKGAENNYFSIGLASRGSGEENVEGEKRGTVFQSLVYVEQYTYYDRSTIRSEAKLKPTDLKENTWIRLMVRIRTTRDTNNQRKRRQTEKAIATILIDCKEVAEFELKAGPLEKYPLTGYAVFGMELEHQATRNTMAAKYRYPGAVFQPEIINGAKAFQFFDRCTADFSLQNIPSEPLAREYNEEKMKLFYELSSSDVKTIKVTCEYVVTSNNETKTKTKYTGEIWKYDNCETWECVNGKIDKKYSRSCSCKTNSGKLKKKYEEWIDEGNKCNKKKCVKEFEDIISELIQCPELKCDKYGTLTPEQTGECCGKCVRDNCKDGRIFKEKGCIKKCESGFGYKCPDNEIKAGCYCPKGSVEDENGKCIKSGTCMCKSGSKLYMPGQTAVRSSCSTCVCTHGVMRCFDRCDF